MNQIALTQLVYRPVLSTQYHLILTEEKAEDGNESFHELYFLGRRNRDKEVNCHSGPRRCRIHF
jgi:hypothetical protein